MRLMKNIRLRQILTLIGCVALCALTIEAASAAESVAEPKSDGTKPEVQKPASEKTPQELWMELEFGPVFNREIIMTYDRREHYLKYPYIQGISEFAYRFRNPEENLPIKTWSIDISFNGGIDAPKDVISVEQAFGVSEMRVRSQYVNFQLARAGYSSDTDGVGDWDNLTRLTTFTLTGVSWPDRRILFESGIGIKAVELYDDNDQRTDIDWFLNIAQSADFFLIRPLTLGFNVNYAIGAEYLQLWEISAYAGVIYWRTELTVGYHALFWDYSRNRHGPMMGVRLWI